MSYKISIRVYFIYQKISLILFTSFVMRCNFVIRIALSIIHDCLIFYFLNNKYTENGSPHKMNGKTNKSENMSALLHSFKKKCLYYYIATISQVRKSYVTRPYHSFGFFFIKNI